MNLTRGINLRKIAELMPGASGAEVKVIGGPREKEGAEAGSSGFKGIATTCLPFPAQGVCTEAGMYALRERRVHVTQEDFEMAVAKVQVSIFSAFADGGSRAVGIGHVFTQFVT